MTTSSFDCFSCYKNAPKIKHTIAAARLHRAVVRLTTELLHIYII